MVVGFYSDGIIRFGAGYWLMDYRVIKNKGWFIAGYGRHCRVVSFITGYFVFMVFLDGAQGWHIAKTIFKNKWLKYQYLNQLEYLHKKEPYVNGRLAEGY